MNLSNGGDVHSASIGQWRQALDGGTLDGPLADLYGSEHAERWRGHYLGALEAFAQTYGEDGEVVIARCPGQMNLMGMHIDYGGMPSLRMAVRGADTLTVARANADGRVRLRSLLRVEGEAEEPFAPVEFDLAELVPAENVGTQEALLAYAGRVCRQREAQNGSAQATEWEIMPQGQLIYLESYFRQRRALRGFDGLVWSTVSPSGGMSSSSALVVSTAYAALAANGLDPVADMPEADRVDGIGLSEWIRGTRGGTADHGGMILGKTGRLVSVGVFPAQTLAYARVPDEYLAVTIDSGVPRVYDEAVKEETVIAYPLGTFMARELLLPRLVDTGTLIPTIPDWAARIRMIRDVETETLGLPPEGIYTLLQSLPQRTCLAEVRRLAEEAGRLEAFERMYADEIEGKFERIGETSAILLRRRYAFGLAEQARVRLMPRLMNEGRMADALELVRISHDGDLDTEVEDAQLESMRAAAAVGQESGHLAYLPGGYGRMTEAYDAVVRRINAFLDEQDKAAGAVQRLGAGWGGNVGGLVQRHWIVGAGRAEFEALLGDMGLGYNVAQPGEGASLLQAPVGS